MHKTGHAKHILFCSSTLFGQFILLKIVTEITKRDLEMQIMNLLEPDSVFQTNTLIQWGEQVFDTLPILQVFPLYKACRSLSFLS